MNWQFFFDETLARATRFSLKETHVFFELTNKDDEPFKKKEMDIVVFDLAKKEKHCIELKYPINGQYPEQMFSACKDIKFLEQLVLSGFDESYFVMFAKDTPFYSETGDSGIYLNFRKEKLIKNLITKPTGAKDETLNFKGKYAINWMDVKNKLKWFVIKV